MSELIYTADLEGRMEATYRYLNTDLFLVVLALMQDDILDVPRLETRIKDSVETDIGWGFSSGDIGKVCNKLSECGVLAKYKKERGQDVAASQKRVGEQLYCYSLRGGKNSDPAIIATAALKILADNDASIVELTQSKISVNTVKLLVAMFPHSVLDSGPADFNTYCSKFDVTDYGPTYSELKEKTGITEASLHRQLVTLKTNGYIHKAENPKVYRVVGDLLQYAPGNKGGNIDEGLRMLAEKGRLTREGEMNIFTISDLLYTFDTKPTKKALRKKVDSLVNQGYFLVESESGSDYWQLDGKGGRVGLSLVVPLQRFLMGNADLIELGGHAAVLYSNPLDLKRCVTNVLSRYALVSGHVGKPGTR